MKRSICIVALLLALPFSLIAQEDQFFDSDGVRIRYVEAGSGQPILLAHGFTGSLDSAWMATGVFKNLVEDYHVIAFDHHGHGKSGRPREAADYGTKMSLDMIRLLDHLGIEKAHFIGYSMGARTVCKLMVTFPERVLTATLGATPPRRGPRNEAAAQQAAEDVLHDPARIEAGHDVETLAAVTRSREELNVTDQGLSDVQFPVLEIVGSEDPRLPGIKDLDGRIPGIRIVVIAGATHGTETGAHYRPEFIEAIRRPADHAIRSRFFEGVAIGTGPTCACAPSIHFNSRIRSVAV